MTPVEVHHGRVSSRVTSPSSKVSNLIRTTIPASGRTYDAHDGCWVIYKSQVERLLVALQTAGVDVHETGGPA